MNKKDYQKASIQNFFKSILQYTGFERGRDFQIFRDHLFIIKHPMRGKVLSAAKEIYPEYCFYWEHPRILKWF